MADLEAVQVGDTVVCRGGYGKELKELIVERLTATQIIVGENHFSRRTGRLVGVRDSWRPVWIEVMDERNAQAIAEARRVYAQQEIGDQIRHGVITLTFDQLRRIAAILGESPLPGKEA